MPTDKAELDTLAYFGDFTKFKDKFDISKINNIYASNSNLLNISITGKQFEISNFLIEAGIDLNLVNDKGQSALHLICINQNIDTAKLLLENGANLLLKDKYGNTPMWTAVFNCKDRNYDMVELFLKYKPDIVSKNNAGMSPLDFAEQVGNQKLISMLKDALP